jgi:hypothetical protein
LAKPTSVGANAANVYFGVHKWMNLSSEPQRFHSKSFEITPNNIVFANGGFEDSSDSRVFPDHSSDPAALILFINSQPVNSASKSQLVAGRGYLIAHVLL